MVPEPENLTFQIKFALKNEPISMTELPIWTLAERELLSSLSVQFRQFNRMNVLSIEQGDAIDNDRQRLSALSVENNQQRDQLSRQDEQIKEYKHIIQDNNIRIFNLEESLVDLEQELSLSIAEKKFVSEKITEDARFYRDILFQLGRNEREIDSHFIIKKLFAIFRTLRQQGRRHNYSYAEQRIIASPHFDGKFYLETNLDVAEAEVDPLEHYLLHGWKEGRQPSRSFDVDLYHLIFPALKRNNLNPLVHHVLAQRGGAIFDSSVAVKESRRVISRFEIKRNTANIVVVVPVYRDVELTRLCLLAALTNIIEMEARLIIVNDNSPDFGMAQMLGDIASDFEEFVSLLTNENNLGFVKSVNRGIKEAGDADIVLLNSDAIVGDKWLQQLTREAYSAPNVGTVTPLSNNTTISSFPNFLYDNDLPYGLDLRSVQSVFGETLLPNVLAPTGIGFCFYIVRRCIDDVGLFDEANFGRGYGEENDFCQRAAARNWLNIVTPNLFVSHRGGVSFGSDQGELITNGVRMVEKLHPNYKRDVSEFCADDPLMSARIYRQIQLMKLSGKPVILHVAHGLGGGVRQHIDELSEFLEDSVISILLEPVPESREVLLYFDCSKQANTIKIHLTDDLAEFYSIVKAIPITDIHYHHLMNVPLPVVNLGDVLQIPYLITVHDFYFLNGNPTLVNDDYMYPGEYSDTINNERYGLPRGMTPKVWRAKHLGFWSGANSVIFPSQATKDLFEGFFPLDQAKVTWHPELKRDMGSSDNMLIEKKESYRVLVIGALGREKGADFLELVATLAKKSELGIEFVLIGYGYRRLRNIEESGAYGNDDLREMIKQKQADMIFFPAKWPETYSYTLSSAIDSGLPILAPNLGAFTERLLGRGNAILYDYKIGPSDFLSLLESLLQSGMSNSWDQPSKRKNNRNAKYPTKSDYLAHYSLEFRSPLGEVPYEILEKLCIKPKVEYRTSTLYTFARNIYTHSYFNVLRRAIPDRWVFAIARWLK